MDENKGKSNKLETKQYPLALCQETQVKYEFSLANTDRPRIGVGMDNENSINNKHTKCYPRILWGNNNVNIHLQ